MQSQKVRRPLEPHSQVAIEMESGHLIGIDFLKYDCNCNCTRKRNWKRLDTTIKTVEQWNVPRGEPTQFSTSNYFAAEFEDQTDTLRGGLRHFCLLLESCLRNLNLVGHWIRMLQNAITIVFVKEVAL
jgi:hypothetical protein